MGQTAIITNISSWCKNNHEVSIMGQLEDMAMFVRIVEAGSITKAAEQLNIAKSAVSRRLKELEERLGS
ncbi:LysR family transcriptional regulator, partial [Pseudoalteromonas sp. SIMBA_153]